MSDVDLKQITVLYVEDEDAIRDEVVHYLQRRVGTLFHAKNGEEGLAAFAEHKPDIVVSDIMMPVMDGIKMAQAIKKIGPETHIIFATAFNDVHYLHESINLGIDGYVLKPIELRLLAETITRSASVLLKARELAANRAQLEVYHKAAEDERLLVAALMKRMMRPENLHRHDGLVHYFLQPTDVVSGDLIAVSMTRNNKLYLMLADSTGHGLPAALNLLPVNHIFYRMANKCLPVSLIVEEMNWAVREQSPPERYVAALVACIDINNRLIEVWNGGIPSAIFIDAENGETQRVFKSVNLPLGILDQTFVAETDVFQWQEPGQLVVYSDGLSEAENEQGEAFGEERIVDILHRSDKQERFGTLTAILAKHLGSRHAFDDMTLMMVECGTEKTVGKH